MGQVVARLEHATEGEPRARLRLVVRDALEGVEPRRREARLDAAAQVEQQLMVCFVFSLIYDTSFLFNKVLY